VRPTYTHVRHPGRLLDPDESPLGACERQGEEELGVRPSVGRLLLVDWAPQRGINRFGRHQNDRLVRRIAASLTGLHVARDHLLEHGHERAAVPS